MAMTQAELGSGIKQIADAIESFPAKTADDRMLQGALLIGLGLVGSLLHDVKRIAEALEAIASDSKGKDIADHVAKRGDDVGS